ncbi:MAG TPA: flagellar basal body P-ring protein FlgI [Stellaceae bacterium]|jgi:flagellar P-ring protein precursor FlgI|nr:flagellar basal body P-ring protein FlgI [Stellaceae bacterium]
MARQLVRLARFLLLPLAVALAAIAPASADRLKELVQVQGARDNQLIGYGLVGGLAGTGDQTTQVPYTVQALQNMMRQMGLTLPPAAFLQPTAVAAAMVTADLPAFVQIGQKIDVTVSAMGNAKSLRGGVLLMTELRGADGQVYAIAQGSLLVSGFEASGQAASTTVNIPTVAQIPSGAIIERTAKSTFAADGAIMLDLDQRSFGNAARITDAINARMGHIAEATGPAQIAVQAPATPAARVRFIADLLDLNVTTEVPVAEVVIDAQSGTVVLGQDVRIGPAAVAYGGLAVTVNETPEVSQPGPFSRGGTTKVVPRTQVKATEKTAKILELTNAPHVSDIVRNLNAIGATSSDLIAILQALKQSGSLHARIKVI